MSFLALWTLRALVVMLLGGLVTLALRRRSAAVRSQALRATLLAVWLLPLAALVAPRLEITVPRPAAPNVTFSALPPVVASKPVKALPPAPVPATTTVPAATPSPALPTPIDPLSFIPFAYGLGVLVLVARWLVGLLHLRRITRSGTVLAPGILRVSEINVPATYGLLRPAVLLPEASVDWPDARLQAAVLHEEAHVRRRDWLWQTLANLFATLHWFNPAAWLLARTLRDTAEAATDDEVLSQGIAPTAYARELLAVAATASAAGPALTMARRGGVSDRVAAILLPNRDRRRPTRLAAAVLVTALAGSGLVVAGLAEAQKNAENYSVKLRDGAVVELTKVRDYGILPRRTWTPGGTLLPERVLSDDFTKYPGQNPPVRQVALELHVSHLPTENPPSVVLLSGPGSPTAHPSPLPGNTGLELVWSLPRGSQSENVQIGIATGHWQPYAGPEIKYGLTMFRSVAPSHPTPGTTVRFQIPQELAGREVLVQGLDASGKIVVKQAVACPEAAPDRPYVATAAVHLKSLGVKAVQFADRTYEKVEFREVAVAPKEEAAAQVELFAVGTPGGSAWKIDGEPIPSLKVPAGAITVPKGWRPVAVAALVRGNLPQDAWAQATIWDKYAYPSSDFKLVDVPGKPDEKIAWCFAAVRPNVKLSRVGFDLAAGPWMTDADESVGSGLQIIDRGRARINDYFLRLLNVRFTRSVLPDLDRYAELSLMGKGQVPYVTVMRAQPNREGNFSGSVTEGQKIERAMLRSRSVVHVKAESVSLVPAGARRAALADGRTAEIVRVDRLTPKDLSLHPLGEEPIELMTMNNLVGFQGITKGLGFYIKVNGPAHGSPTLAFRVSYPSGFTASRTVGYPRGYEVWHAMFDLPPANVKEAQLSVGVSFGPWAVADRAVKFSTRRVRPGGTCLDVVRPKDLSGDQLRLLAFDQKENLVATWPGLSVLVKDGKTTLVAYSKASTLKNVARVELQNRAVQWSTLPSVSTFAP